MCITNRFPTRAFNIFTQSWWSRNILGSCIPVEFAECRKFKLSLDDDGDDTETQYVLQPIQCGRKPKTYTVRQWLKDFAIPLEDECFIKWSKARDTLSPFLQKLETAEDPFTVKLIQGFTRFVLYELYDTQKPFLEQFEKNVQDMLRMLSDIPSLKSVMRAYGVEFPEINMTSLNWGKPGSGCLQYGKLPIISTEYRAKK